MFATADLSHARGPAGVVFPRLRLACFFPLFRPGALPIELARGFFSHSLCWSPPCAGPLERTVDQNRQQKHRTQRLQQARSDRKTAGNSSQIMVADARAAPPVTALSAGSHGKGPGGGHRPHPLARQVEKLLAQLGRVGLFRQPYAIPGKLLEVLC